jgi:hypothetical protein
MALIKIDATHKDAIAKVAATYGVQVEFFTNERNPALLTVDIHIADLELMFSFASGVRIEVEMQQVKHLENLYKQHTDKINSLLTSNKP